MDASLLNRAFNFMRYWETGISYGCLIPGVNMICSQIRGCLMLAQITACFCSAVYSVGLWHHNHPDTGIGFTVTGVLAANAVGNLARHFFEQKGFGLLLLPLDLVDIKWRWRNVFYPTFG